MSGYHDNPERLTETLSAYLDGALTTGERDALEKHLENCAECQRELAGLARVGALLRALPEPDLSRSFTLPEPAKRTVSARRPPAWTRAAQWVGGLAAALGLGLLVLGALPQVGQGLAGIVADRHSISSAGGASSAPPGVTGVHDPTYSGSPAPTGTGVVSATAGTPKAITTPTTTPAPTPSATPFNVYGPANSGQVRQDNASAPLEPVGAALLIGGGAALTVGTVRRRRSRAAQVDQR